MRYLYPRGMFPQVGDIVRTTENVECLFAGGNGEIVHLDEHAVWIRRLDGRTHKIEADVRCVARMEMTGLQRNVLGTNSPMEGPL